MNPGIKLTDLASELERQVSAKHDYVADTSKIAMLADGLLTRQPDGTKSSSLALAIRNGDDMTFGVNDLAHDQIAGYTKIPRPYYDRMRTDAPNLLAKNVNEWLARANEKRMVRTLDGNTRAFLSSRYRPLDNYDLAIAALPALKDAGVKVISSGLTETHMRFKGIVESLAIGLDDLGWAGSKGDAIIPVIGFGNSEVGAGSVYIEAGYYLSSCTNLSMWKDLGLLRKYHVGRSFDEGDVSDLYTDETRIADDRAFWLKVRDAIAGAINRDIFMQRIVTLQEARDRRIEKTENVAAVVEVTLRKFSLPDTLAEVVAKTLASKYDMTAFGLSNAITDVAGTFQHDRYELSTRMEHVGGEIIDLPASEWKVIASAEPEDKKPVRSARDRAAAGAR